MILKETGEFIGFCMTGIKDELPTPNREIAHRAFPLKRIGAFFILKIATHSSFYVVHFSLGKRIDPFLSSAVKIFVFIYVSCLQLRGTY